MRVSSGSMPMAMMPPRRTLANSVKAVFLTVPAWVAKKMKPGCCQVTSSLAGPCGFDADEGGDLLAGLEFEEVGDASAFGGAAHVGDFVHALDVDASGVGEEHQVIVRARGEEVLDEIGCVALDDGGFAGGHADHAFAAAALGAVGEMLVRLIRPLWVIVMMTPSLAMRSSMAISPFVRDEVGQTRRGVLGLDLLQFGLDEGEHARLLGEDVEQIVDGGEQGFVFGGDLVAFRAR